jgi:hypothetical protein
MMQWCLVGMGKRSIFSTGAALLALFVLPENAKKYYQSYCRGKQIINISNWDFFSLLAQPYINLQTIIFHKTKLAHV